MTPIEYLCQSCCLYHNLNDSYSYLLRYTWNIDWHVIKISRPKQNVDILANDIVEDIFLNENFWTPYNMSLKCVLLGLIHYDLSSLVQIMARTE